MAQRQGSRVSPDEIVVDAKADDQSPGREDGEEVGDVLEHQVGSARVSGKEQKREAEAEDDGQTAHAGNGAVVMLSLIRPIDQTRLFCCFAYDRRRHIRSDN